MRVIEVSNVNWAYPAAFKYVMDFGHEEETRNGPVYTLVAPVTTMYKHPVNRVLFDPIRDANPFFHVMEALWMLAGRKDLKWIMQFNKQMAEYSDDGVDLNAAYGYRWRSHFGLDQIHNVIMELKEDPKSRRAVIAMWDPAVDLHCISKDLPCNTTIFFQIKQSSNRDDPALDMMVCNRSNDLIWGKYGANVVHMSFLQEYVAALIGVPVGIYYHTTFNLHVYLDMIDKYWPCGQGMDNDLYIIKRIKSEPLVDEPISFMQELDIFFELNGAESGRCYQNKFIETVAIPMFKAWKYFKQKDWERVYEAIGQIKSLDWKYVCKQWMSKRERGNNPITTKTETIIDERFSETT